MTNIPQSTPAFEWPQGKLAACTLSFDDARRSQAERGLPILNRFGLKGSFYVSSWGVGQRLDDWKGAVAAGHEIGNHTAHHPCSFNHRLNPKFALEDFTLEQMQQEFELADARILEILGVTPRTFAYPCGHKFVGRGEGVRSYVPLAARHFLAARGFRDEMPNDPHRCDLAQLGGLDADTASFEQLKMQIDRAVEWGGWLVLVAHEIGDAGPRPYTLEATVLEAVCDYLQQLENEVWTDTLANIATYVQAARAL
jgi:peptidoglycan-N-acetylglucosamine deacetylase